jgi:hypothetical protein
MSEEHGQAHGSIAKLMPGHTWTNVIGLAPVKLVEPERAVFQTGPKPGSYSFRLEPHSTASRGEGMVPAASTALPARPSPVSQSQGMLQGHSR